MLLISLVELSRMEMKLAIWSGMRVEMGHDFIALGGVWISAL